MERDTDADTRDKKTGRPSTTSDSGTLQPIDNDGRPLDGRTPLKSQVPHLQRAIGNRAVARTLQRASSPVEARSSTQLPGAALGRQIHRYGMDNAPNPHRVRVATGEVLPPDYSSKDDAGKLQWIGQFAAIASPQLLNHAWSELGDPMAAARGNAVLFAQCIKRSPGLGDVGPFKAIKDRFGSDIESRARNILGSNRATVDAELQKIGGGENSAPTAEQDFAVQDIQKLSESMSEVRRAKAALLDTTIGHREVLGNAYSGSTRDSMVKFTPDGAPSLTRPLAGKPTWEQANAQWRKMLAVEAAIIRQSPSAAFFMRADQTEDPKKLKDMEIKTARTEISRGLLDLKGKINEAEPKVGADLKFSDFVPLHSQLFSGQASASNTPWANPVEKAIGQSAIADADMQHLLTTIGVGTATAAAFILAEFATGGLATFLFAAGATASGIQAGVAWDHYADLSAAANATVDPDLALVSGDQVSSAMVEAILATVFAFLDGAGAAVGIRNAARATSLLNAARAGEALAAKAALRGLGSGADAAPKLAKALAELGPHEVRTITGKSYRELAVLAGESTPEGQMLARLAERDAGQLTRSLEELSGQLRSLKDVPRDQIERVISEGIAHFGNAGVLTKAGGWKSLMSSGVGGTAVGRQLESWRAGIMGELREFVAEASKDGTKVIRTGTPAASSDVDVQLIGGQAASLQQRSEAWLAARLGTNEKQAKLLLDAEIFVDSTRAHLQDVVAGLDQQVRAQITAEATAFEKQMIFGARLEEARAQGQAAVDAVLAEARDIGVTPFAGFRRLSESEQSSLARRIDEMVTRLERTTDPAERAALVRDIGKSQAMINASHPDAYVGGGVRLWVTDRPIDAEAFASAGITLKTGLGNSQRVVAALSEGRWIQRALQQLELATDAEKAATALRNIGKHGERVSSVLRAGHPPSPENLKVIGDQLIAFKKSFDAGTLTAQAARDLPALQQQARSLLGQLKSESSAAIRFLEQDMRALQLPAEEVAKFHDWVQSRVLIDGIAESINGAILAFVRSVESGLQVSLNNTSPVTPAVPSAPIPMSNAGAQQAPTPPNR